jgi:hypothetical protein
MSAWIRANEVESSASISSAHFSGAAGNLPDMTPEAAAMALIRFRTPHGPRGTNAIGNGTGRRLQVASCSVGRFLTARANGRAAFTQSTAEKKQRGVMS